MRVEHVREDLEVELDAITSDPQAPKRHHFLLGTVPTQPGLPPGHAAQSSDEAEVGEHDEVKETDVRAESDETAEAKSKSPVR